MPDIPELPAKNSDASPVAETTWEDLVPHLDRELHRLPEKYRAAIVLCDLEGKSQAEAARQLGLNVGALSMQLTRGRRLLADRLTRNKVAIASGTTLALMLQTSAPAAVPVTLAAETLQLAGIATILPVSLVPASVVPAAVGATTPLTVSTPFATTLAQGVIKSMAISSATKIGIPVALILLTGLGGITLLNSHWIVPATSASPAVSALNAVETPPVVQGNPVAPPATPPQVIASTSEKAFAGLQGKWRLIAVEQSGQKVDEIHWKQRGDLLEITGDQFLMDSTGKKPGESAFAQGKINVDTGATPYRMTWYDMQDLKNTKVPNVHPMIGIFQIENNTLKFCCSPPTQMNQSVSPPTEFKTHPDRAEMLMSYQRQ